MLLREIKNIFQKELNPLYPKEEVSSFFYILIEHYLKLERFVLVLNPELSLSKEEEQPLFEALTQLKQQRPIQYITAETDFMDMTLAVNEHVLIPRPETEELVQWILSEYTQEDANPKLNILDIGTGSGCIAIALAKKLPLASVYALDTEEEILQLAGLNAERNNVKINFILADVFKTELLEIHFDIIVSNPPYVRVSEKKSMKANVKNYEPAKALYVSDTAPLVFYERIAALAMDNLKKEGSIFLEINQYLGMETKRLLEDHNFTKIVLRKDMFGNHRMLKGVKDNYE